MTHLDPYMPVQAGSNPEELRLFEDLITNATMERSRLFSNMMDPRRDVYKECGLPTAETRFNPWDLWHLTEREPVALRVVECLPREMWKITPTVYDTENANVDSVFEKAVDGLASTLLPEPSYHQEEEGSSIWELLQRAHIESRKGQYGVIVLGLDDVTQIDGTYDEGTEPDGKVVPLVKYGDKRKIVTSQMPVDEKREHKLLHIHVFPQTQAQVTTIDSDPGSRRYGQPMMYSITYNSPNDFAQGAVGQGTFTHNVHWSRVVHISDGVVFHRPPLKPVYNELIGLQKLYAGSPEMYWKAAFPGISFETHPQLGGEVKLDKNGLRSMYERYSNGLQRALFLTGMSAKTLAPQVSDPTPNINMLIEAICIKEAIPVPVFKGYEIGEQASTNNDSDWKDRVMGFQKTLGTPRIIRPFFDRLINLGILPKPKGGKYKVYWPPLKEQAPTEKATVALTNTQAIGAYIGGNVASQISPIDWWTRIMGLEEADAQQIIDGAEEHLQEESDWQAEEASAQGLPDGSVPGQPGELPQVPEPPPEPPTN